MSCKKKLFKTIMYLVLFSFIIGFVKVEYFLSFLYEDLTNSARVMSYITLSLGTVFFYFLIIISIFFSYSTIEFLEMGKGFAIDNFYKSISKFIYNLFFNEISKLIITLFTFESQTIYYEEEFNNILIKNTLWLNLIEFSDIIFIGIGSCLYLFSFISIDKKVKPLNVVISALPLVISFFIFRYVNGVN